jgi:hypothetical protein
MDDTRRQAIERMKVLDQETLQRDLSKQAAAESGLQSFLDQVGSFQAQMDPGLLAAVTTLVQSLELLRIEVRRQGLLTRHVLRLLLAPECGESGPSEAE